MSELALEPEDVERRRAERAYRLAVHEIPRLRIIGSFFISIGVFINNRFVLGQASIAAWAWITIMLAVYCFVSWLLLRHFYPTKERLTQGLPSRDMTVDMLAADVVIWTLIIYATGAERSLLFFILLVRVADQTHTTFRRCIRFAILITVCYAAMLAWVALVEGRDLPMAVASMRLIGITAAGIYISLTARNAERRRAQMARSLNVARDLVRQLEVQSVELQDARARAESASAAKSEFVANMSHEMRTPLHGVIGMLQLALAEEESPRRLRQLEMARRSAESLLAAIETILDFSKIEARRIDIEPIYFSLRDLISETVRPLGVTAAAKGLILSAGVASDVPDSVWGDPIRLRQVLVNLIGNAVKFTDRGEVVLRVSMSEKAIRFEVRDTGVGIPADQQERIFDPFTQADEARSRQAGGTGLGLSIVARLVEAMGSAIEVESVPGSGSIFSFALTLPHDMIGSEPVRLPWEHSLAGRTVLLIDPFPQSREVIAAMLQARGMAVTTASSAAEPPPGRFECAVVAGESSPIQPAIYVMSPLEHVAGDKLHVTRPVAERELIEAIGVALGFTRTSVVRAPALRAGVDQPLRVLIAEDNLVNQEFATEALGRLGHRISVASDGEEALGMMRREFYDLVLMDVQMPRLSGLEVTERFRETEPKGIHVPIVALTANTSREDRHKCIEAGMDAVLSKPIDLNALQDVVRLVTGVEPLVEAVGGNPNLLERVSVAFAKQTPGLLAEMRDAIMNKQGEVLYGAAHKMKGAVSNFQTDPSVDLCVMLEEAARAEDYARAILLLTRLEASVTALERRIAAALITK